MIGIKHKLNGECAACTYLHELYSGTKQMDRHYYVMTELFVMLHNGKDYCEGISSENLLPANKEEIDFLVSNPSQDQGNSLDYMGYRNPSPYLIDNPDLTSGDNPLNDL